MDSERAISHHAADTHHHILAKALHSNASHLAHVQNASDATHVKNGALSLLERNYSRSGFNGTHGHRAELETSPGVAILLLYVLLLLMLGAQTALFVWKKKHKRSYELVTLVGLWLIPAVISLQLHFWRFLTVWGGYTIATAYIASLLLGKRMQSTTPRKVYSWFLGVYRLSTYIGVAGYILLIVELCGLAPVIVLVMPPQTPFLLLCYGLYFGVLGRDCAEVATDRMALVMGSGQRIRSTVNNCGICGNEMKDYSHLGEEADGSTERVVQLSCRHCFHDLCIRGWTMVGKKDICPVCNEKVELRSLYADRPWETRNLSWIQMLDAVRYIVVWNPIIFLVFTAVSHLFPHTHHISSPSIPGTFISSPQMAVPHG